LSERKKKRRRTRGRKEGGNEQVIAATTVSRLRNAHPPTKIPGLFPSTVLIAWYLIHK